MPIIFTISDFNENDAYVDIQVVNGSGNAELYVTLNQNRVKTIETWLHVPLYNFSPGKKGGYFVDHFTISCRK